MALPGMIDAVDVLSKNPEAFRCVGIDAKTRGLALPVMTIPL
jgi:hypothetical protein